MTEPTRETQSERLSFRATARNAEKLLALAKAKGWINAKGQPNVSAVLNFLIETFDMTVLGTKKDSKESKKKEKSNGR
jgi:hypothetical protein